MKRLEFYAVFNPYPFFVVNLHDDAVVRAYGQVGQKVILTFQPLVYQILYKVLVDHSFDSISSHALLSHIAHCGPWLLKLLWMC